MSEMEKEELKNQIKGMSEEELLVALKIVSTDMLWEELRRREEMQRKIIFDVKNVLHEKEED